jgi:hypothetical protein
MKKHLSLILLPFLFIACASPERKKQKEILSLQNTLEVFNTAFKEGNLPLLDSLTTNDYMHTNGDDRAISKERWINYLENRSNDIASGVLKVDKYQLLEQEIKMYENSALVTGLIITSGFTNGSPFNHQIRVSNFWIKENNTWKRAGFHDTRVQ